MARHRYDPLAALAPKAQRRQAYALLAPLIAQINAEFDRRAAAGSRSIGDYTDALVQRLSPMAGATHQTYAAATDQQRADDAALADRLTSFGKGLGSEIAARPGVQEGTFGDPAATARGASNAGFAMGSSKLAQLLAQGAAAEGYTGQLPGIARLGGAQQARNLQAQLEGDRSSALSSTRQQIPKLLQQIQAQEFQKAVAVQSGLINQAKVAETGAYHQATLAQRAQQSSVDNLFKQARVNISQDQLNLAKQREKRLNRTKSGGAGGFTPAQVMKLRADAIEAVKDWKHGQLNPNYDPQSSQHHKGVPDTERWLYTPRPHDARGVFRSLVLHGIPPTMADWAVGQVYGRWKAPGERSGRGAGGAGPR